LSPSGDGHGGGYALATTAALTGVLAADAAPAAALTGVALRGGGGGIVPLVVPLPLAMCSNALMLLRPDPGVLAAAAATAAAAVVALGVVAPAAPGVRDARPRTAAPGVVVPLVSVVVLPDPESAPSHPKALRERTETERNHLC